MSNMSMRRVLQELVEKAMEERSALGLHIPEIDIEIGVFQTNLLAVGYPTKGKNLLILNPSYHEEEERSLEEIRCEIERLAILEAKINEHLLKINSEEKRLEENIGVRWSKEKEKELVMVKKRKMENFLHIEPINECCFLIFSFVPYNSWEELRANPNATKEAIINSFRKNTFSYGERFAEVFLIDAYSAERINDNTCKYVWNILYYGEREEEREGVAEAENVNVSFARNILDKVSKYQRKVNENAKKATNAIVMAYVESPSRLRRAYEETSSYDEFLDCLMHD